MAAAVSLRSAERASAIAAVQAHTRPSVLVTESDSGSMYSAVPFSSETNTGSSFVNREMDLTIFSVPQHKGMPF